MSAQGSGLIWFKEIAFKGPMKLVFIGLPVGIVAIVVVALALSSIAPPAYKGTSAGGGPDIMVGEYSQELRLTISYTFHLIPGDRGGWKTDDGINETSFTFQLEDKNGGIAGK